MISDPIVQEFKNSYPSTDASQSKEFNQVENGLFFLIRHVRVERNL